MGLLAHLAQTSDGYGTPSDSMSTADGAAFAVFFGVFAVFFLIFLVISYVIHAFLLSVIFKKAGVDAWIAWVPVYNFWKMLEIGDQQGFWAILLLIPGINIVAGVFGLVAMYNIGLKLQKEGWFVLLAIFVPIVWMVWLAFDKSVWTGAKVVPVTKTVKSA